MGISRVAAASWCKKELLMRSTSTEGDDRRVLKEKIQDTSSSGIVAADFYHRYKVYPS